MHYIFKRLPLPVKLMLIGLIPLIFLLYLAIEVNNEKAEKIEVMDKFLKQVVQSTSISSLVDALHMERRYSFAYLLDRKNIGNLAIQRAKTDAVIKDIEDANADMKNFSSYTLLDKLPDIRNNVDKGLAGTADLMNFYTNAIFRLNALSPVSSENIPYLKPIVKEHISQKLLTDMVTYLGTIRINILIILDDNIETRNSFDEVRNLYHTYTSIEQELYLKGSEKVINRYNEIKAQPEFKDIFERIETIYKTENVDTAYNSDVWWSHSVKMVDAIKTLQREASEEIKGEVKNIYDTEKANKDKNLIALIAIIILVVFILFYTIRSISMSLTELREAAERLAHGDTDIELDVNTNDVIGSLATSIRQIQATNKTLAEAAAEIGKGNFAIPVTPRSDDDLLGNALVQMKSDLQTFRLQNEEKIWIQNGINIINDAVSGEKTVKEIGTESLNALTDYLDIHLAVFYSSVPDNQLEFICGNAVSDISKIPRHLPFGQSLVGQAATDRAPILLEDAPDDYIKISSSTGETSPKHIYIIPLIHNNIVKGVIELASLTRFREADIHFIEEAANNIAVALQVAKSRARLQELLEETQAQAEELQTQHSELENLNTELEAQAQKLQASEEELKVQQEELLQANQELEENTRALEEKNQMIVERNLEIQKKAEELALSTKYKSEFLANMSHELRTPLNSILLLSRLMAENNDNNLTDEQVEYAQVIQSSGNGLLALIDEILDLSKIESGKMKLEYGSVAVSEIVDDMEMLFKPLAKEKKLQFISNIDKALPSRIETDKMRLEQIIKNLISNALKFTSKGSITLDISGIAEEGIVQFSVKDTGIGIPEEKQHLIFEAFQQADGSTRRKYGGTGLGLSISRELARLLGGEIILNSEVGRGSEFIVRIPASKDLAEELRTEIAQPEDILEDIQHISNDAKEEDEEEETNIELGNDAKGDKKYSTDVIPDAIPDDRDNIKQEDKCLLIVEDDTNFAKSLLDFTRKRGYKGIVCVRGDEALKAARKYKPLGILLDIQLPVKNGWEVMEELKSDPKTKHIPVHMMSSYEVKNESLMKGAIDFINKPVAFEKMQEIFSKLEFVLNNNPRKVLIVEENPKHAKALAYFLDNFDVKTEIQNNVTGSIDSLKKSEVNCVILDMSVPDQKSYDALEEVKTNTELGNIPIIIFTGKSLSKAEEQRIRKYADSIIVKTAYSYQRVVDEVSLFLHLMEENNKQSSNGNHHKKLGKLTEVLKGKKVLVTDDDVRNIFSLTKALEALKMQVITATDGKEAIRQLEEHPDIDIVLMDMMMPEMDGYESTSLIRKDPRFRNLPIIAVTAKAMTGDREKCISAGASDYITKPVDIDQLLSLLRVWMYER